MAPGKDVLANEVSIEGKLDETGVKLKAKSRLISGVDRFFGNVAELLNAPMERRTARVRGETALIEAISSAAVAKLDDNPELGEHLAKKYLGSAVRRIENGAAATMLAIEDLSARPPTPEQCETGADTIAPEFLDRWERYAEDASTEELRTKWGKVLAAEVRQPGRVSRRTMRALDELPSDVALRFEALCAHRIRTWLPKVLTGELSFDDLAAYDFYGLIQHPGITGHIIQFSKAGSPAPLWLLDLGTTAISLPHGLSAYGPDQTVFVPGEAGIPQMPVYLLTDFGEELASIFGHQAENAVTRLIAAITNAAAAVGGYEISLYARSPQGNVWRLVTKIPPISKAATSTSSPV